ncbi:MAG: EcsC family protein [Bdellovibrionales bacterium]|nr:EcsC family protein [Oligoflexia bacterium]
MSNSNGQKDFTPEEEAFIREAAEFFENPGLFAKAMNWVGGPLEKVQNKLPENARLAVNKATRFAIEKAVLVSVKTVPAANGTLSFSEATSQAKLSGFLHTGAATAVGGVGGLFGLAALPVELPVATVLILRSILDIAQKYGNDLSTIENRLECVYVFSLGSKSANTDALDSAYYTSRLVFGEMLKKVAAFVASSTAKEILIAVEKGTAPMLVRFISEIAAQLEVRVTKKMLVQVAPVLGSVGGAGINLLFANFFQDAARYHFGMKKLELDKGYEQTRIAFEGARQKAGKETLISKK